MLEPSLIVDTPTKYESSNESSFVEVFLSSDAESNGILKRSRTNIQIAFNESLKKSGLCSIDASNPNYKITALILSCDFPLMGLDYRSDVEIKYDIKKEGSLVHSTVIKTDNVAKLGEAFVADDRLRISIEGSLRKNTLEFIKQFDAFIKSQK